VIKVAVPLGVATGILIGLIKVVLSIELTPMLFVSYATTALVTHFSDEQFVNIGWDSAGVTTGPITVPLVLSLGSGLGMALQAKSGFGILTMCSVCPILAVLLSGWMPCCKNSQVVDDTNDGACTDAKYDPSHQDTSNALRETAQTPDQGSKGEQAALEIRVPDSASVNGSVSYAASSGLTPPPSPPGSSPVQSPRSPGNMSPLRRSNTYSMSQWHDARRSVEQLELTNGSSDSKSNTAAGHCC
jgi:hypothetical protein